ncbi:LamG domain-containing protein, partial [Candidatus Woesearchaeota archaeon]|nr:LamG domain-containing protein [Candidatus Woesearchaeota archaeon]
MRKIVLCLLVFLMLACSSYAWWDDSYDYRFKIDCSDVAAGTPIVVNGSDGFSIDGHNQLVWTVCGSNNLSVYFNNYTDYVVANENGQVAFEVETGTGTSYNPEDIWSDYKAVFHGNVNGSYQDSTVNENDGTINGSVFEENNGIVDGAYYFDGSDDYVSLPLSLSPEDYDISYAVWFKTNSTGVKHRLLIGGTKTDESDWFYFGMNGQHKIQFNADDGSNPTGLIVTSGTYNDGNWHLATLTRDASNDNFTLFVDANWIGSDTNIDSGIHLNQINVGAYTAAQWSFEDMIDEVRVYNGTLSGDEIYQTYQNTLGISGYGTLLAKENQTSPAPPARTVAYMNYNNVGNFTALGNIIATYFIGDGSLLTGIFDTWWPLKSGGYLVNDSNQLDIDEAKLNATIDARAVFPGPDYDSGWV